MGSNENKKKYDLQYAKDKLKRIPLDVPKEQYEAIKAHASARGESVNGFIKRAITETMERDTKTPQSAPAGLAVSVSVDG